MTSRGARGRAALVGLGLAFALTTGGRGVRAQTKAPTPEELKAARETFQEAYKDEQEKRFAEALEKFQRVAVVKESASVRYRIGSVLEQLGRLREARDAFRALAASKPSLTGPEQEIADNAAERAHQLDRKIPRLVLRLKADVPPDTRVSIDGAPVPASTAPRRIELDPGEHLVQALSPSAQSSESKVTLGEGGEVEFAVTFAANPASVPPSPRQPPPPPLPPPPPVEHRDNTLAYVALGAGGVLLVSGVVLLALREGDISDIKSACGANGTCPPSLKNDLQSKHDQAQLFGPFGVGLGVAGLALAGAGGYLLLRPSKPAAVPSGAVTPPSSSGLRVSPRPVAGGAMLGVGAAF
jgi:hypothetical protein